MRAIDRWSLRYEALQKPLQPGASLLARTWGAFMAERAWSNAVQAYTEYIKPFAATSGGLRELCGLSLHDGRVVSIDRTDDVVALTIEGRGFWGPHGWALAKVAANTGVRQLSVGPWAWLLADLVPRGNGSFSLG